MSEKCKKRVPSQLVFGGLLCSRSAVKDGYCAQHLIEALTAERDSLRAELSAARRALLDLEELLCLTGMLETELPPSEQRDFVLAEITKART